MFKTDMSPREINMGLDKLKNATNITCDECGNKYFDRVFEMKRISPVLTPTGQPILVPIQLYICTECGHINKEFVDAEIQQARQG